MVHFTTTVSGAQVIVAGSKMGVVTWYIAQPPMKTFTILTTEAVHSPSPIISLQVRYNCLYINTKCIIVTGVLNVVCIAVFIVLMYNLCFVAIHGTYKFQNQEFFYSISF